MSRTAPRVLRPAIQEYLAWVKHPDATAVVFATVLVGVPLLGAAVRWLINGEGAGLIFMLGLVVLGVVLGLGGALLSMRTTSVNITDTTIEHRRWFVRHTVLLRDGLRGILCDYRPPVSQKGSALLVLQAADGRGPRIRLNGAFWATSDLETIADAAGVPREDRELRARAVEDRLPGILRFQERRPVIALALFPVAALVIAIGGGALYVALIDDDEVAAFPAAAEREQDALVRDVSGAVDAAWRETFGPRVSECDAVADGLQRRVERSAQVTLDADQLRAAPDLVADAARTAGLDGVDVSTTSTAFEVQADDGTSAFAGGSSLEVAYEAGEITLVSLSRCVPP